MYILWVRFDISLGFSLQVTLKSVMREKICDGQKLNGGQVCSGRFLIDLTLRLIFQSLFRQASSPPRYNMSNQRIRTR